MVDYVEALRKLGINKDDIVYVASSAVGMIWNPEICNDSCISLRNYITEGSVLMPTFCSDFYKEGVFDLEKSGTICGLISDYFRKMDGVKRSRFSPMHSVATLGKDAKEISELRPETSYGESSVFGWMAERSKRVKLLFIDCSINDGMAFIHYLEEIYKVDYRFLVNLSGKVRDFDGERTISIGWYAKKEGGEFLGPKIAGEFEKTHYVKSVIYNNSEFKVCSLEDFLNYFKTLMDKDKNVLRSKKLDSKYVYSRLKSHIEVDLGKYTDEEIQIFYDALNYINELYIYRRRDQGTPFITHPLEVIKILQKEFKVEMTIKDILIALMHDALWVDCDNTKNDIRHRFGAEIVDPILLFTKPHILEKREKENSDEERFFQSFIDMEERYKYIKLADKLHNLRDIKNCKDVDKKEKYLVNFNRYVSFLQKESYENDMYKRILGKVMEELKNVSIVG